MTVVFQLEKHGAVGVAVLAASKHHLTMIISVAVAAAVTCFAAKKYGAAVSLATQKVAVAAVTCFAAKKREAAAVGAAAASTSSLLMMLEVADVMIVIYWKKL